MFKSIKIQKDSGAQRKPEFLDTTALGLKITEY